jgi:hypothetical protein
MCVAGCTSLFYSDRRTLNQGKWTGLALSTLIILAPDADTFPIFIIIVHTYLPANRSTIDKHNILLNCQGYEAGLTRYLEA